MPWIFAARAGPDPMTLSDVAGAMPAIVAVLLGGSAIVALLPAGEAARRAAYGLAALASLGMAALAVLVLAGSGPVALTAGDVLGFHLVDVRIDPLSAVFVLMLGVVGVAASVYAIGYVPHGGEAGRRPEPVLVAYPVFLASLLLVFVSADAVSFLIAWEGMALSSAALVVGARPSLGQARAGYVYLALTHAAAAALVIAFAVLAAAGGSTSIDGMGAAAHQMAEPERSLLFGLLLIGFATKAGVVPLHVWLPRAHPVAPSHVSALMSGVMVKAGVYGLVRFVLVALGPGPEWWGLAVLALGAVSAVLGVLYALMEHDLKRLLAFSTIENVGIILLGLGAAMVAASVGQPTVAALALAAALLHTFNHASIKGLLFLATGSVQHAAGTRDLNRLGGLARVLPATTIAFALGAAAMAGAPPLNGFAGEWLTFQGLFAAASAGGPSPLGPSALLLGAGALALGAALALAAFVKATGTGFLALPRTAEAAEAHESGWAMVLGMALLGAVCVGAGLGAGAVAGVMSAVAGPLLGLTSSTVVPTLTLAGPAGASYGPVPLALVLLVVFGAVWFVGIRGRAARRAPTWTCGIAPEPAFEYTATSYGKLIRLFFGRVLRPVREVEVELHAGTPFPRTVRYRGRARHLIDERVYLPLQRGAVGASQLARRLQNGSLQLYLAYTVLALVALLLVARP